MATFTAINRGTGEIQIHRAGCKDIKRDARGASIWDIEAESLQEITEDVAGDFMLEEEEPNWQDYVGEFTMVNCTRGMLAPKPDTLETPEEEQAAIDRALGKRTRRPQMNHKECQHEATPKARKACRKAHWAAQGK